MAIDRGLFVLSDGVGGQEGGAVASQLVVSLLPRLLERELASGISAAATDTHVGDALRRAVASLNAEVRQRSVPRRGQRGMAATVVLALLRGSSAHVAHLGDSRAYLLRKGRLRRLTTDHTVASTLRGLHEGSAAGVWDPPASQQLTRFVGMAGQAVPDVQTVPLEQGDRLLLCSDGLTSMLPERLAAHLLRHQPGPEGACRVLVGAANEAGGRDNVSVIVVYVDAIPPRPLS